MSNTSAALRSMRALTTTAPSQAAFVRLAISQRTGQLQRPRGPESICLRCRIQASAARDFATTPRRLADDSKSFEDPQTFSTLKPTTLSSSSSSQPQVPSPTTTSKPRQVFSTFMDTLQTRILYASRHLNDLTGYTAIEALRSQNAKLESRLSEAQATLRAARSTYKSVNARRATTQREVTTLLARKDTWSPADLERFTTLYRQDHELEAAVASASSDLTEAEGNEARLNQALNSGILRRYHEEQIWSDRIRRQSTWGTWGLMGINVLLFLVLQFVAEPWKRNRLMKGIAAEEREALEAVRWELGELRSQLAWMRGLEAREMALETKWNAPAVPSPEVAPKTVPGSSVETPAAWQWRQSPWLDVERWKLAAQDLANGQHMGDPMVVALESIAVGVAVLSGVAVFALRR